MFYYNKKIIYIDLQKDGNKIKNAGFLRWEENESSIKWTIRIRGLYETDMGYFDLCSENGEMLDKILLKKGEGNYFREFEKGRSIRKAGTIEKIYGIQISFADGRCLKGSWEVPHHAETNELEEVLQEKNGAEAEETLQAEEWTEPEETLQAEVQTDEEEVLQEEKRTQLRADKWEQLQQLYPTVHPFRDEREFLSITPGDFVILEQQYHRMVSNSFLLHGYYNYRHVLLGKYRYQDQDIYYLGVPGVYYDQEKMAAEMFGFEAFEGKNSPAEPGSFGYYMKKVKI